MGDAAVECATCRAVVYCGAKCEAADAGGARPLCALSPRPVGRARADARIAPRRRRRWRPRSTTKLLGEETARKLIGPRGYRRGEEDDEDGKDEASRDAVKLRWGALFKLAKGSSEGPSGDTKDEHENGDERKKKRAAALRALGDSLSFPLSIVAASWMFPIVYYTLSIGGRREARARRLRRNRARRERRGGGRAAQIHLSAPPPPAAARPGAQWWPCSWASCKLPPRPVWRWWRWGKA